MTYPNYLKHYGVTAPKRISCLYLQMKLANEDSKHLEIIVPKRIKIYNKLLFNYIPYS